MDCGEKDVRREKWGEGRAWIELVRVPNLPTVPGDPLAGFALASIGRGAVDWGRALPVVCVSVLFYLAGLIWNDCADLAEDRESRPERPLPSGRVNRVVAAGVASLLGIGGMAIAASLGRSVGVAAVVLLMLILAYDFVSRRVRLVGLVNMGACRGASLLLGATAVAPPTGWPVVAAVGVSLYIIVVAWIAVDETRDPRIGKRVGMLIRLLIPFQAGMCLFGGDAGVIAAVLVLLGWPVSVLLAKRFYAS